MDASLKTIGKRYVLHEMLGQGGMGVVYRATDRLTGREVALKRVNADAAELGLDNSFEAVDFRLALAREFKLSASLRHPNIIKVLDYGFDTQQQPYFTMELLKNPQTILEASQTLPLAQRIELIVQMCHALTYLHRRGILHRDLKPANVLVADGTVKLLDFGLSTVRERTDNVENAADTTAGTLAYMAPETLMGDTTGVPSDLYAVGMMSYEIIARKHPFHVDQPAELINEIMFITPAIEDLDVSNELASVIERLLRKDPLTRFQSAAEVADMLSKAMNIPEVTEIRAIRESFLQAAALVGRDIELKRLSDALHETLHKKGSAWLIAGENGVGKTRLVDELRRLAMVQGAVVMRGQTVRVGSRPYEMWRAIFRWLPLLEDDLSDTELALLGQFIPDLQTLVARDLDQIKIAPVPAEKLKTHLKEFIERVLSKQTTPIVMIFEDLQWAGSESLKLLSEISAFVESTPLLLIATLRDDEAPDLPQQFRGLRLLKLRRLSEEAVAELSAAMLGEGGRSPQVVDLLRRETEGNVFFVIEVVRALAEEIGNLEHIGRTTLPQQVFAGGMRAVIARRLEQVDERSRETLRLAAAMGRELNLQLLHIVAPDVNLQDWLIRCASAAILEVENDEWFFAHDKLREALLGNLKPAKQKALHTQIAQRLEDYYGSSSSAHVAALAYHWQQAGNVAKEEYYVTLAGEQALRNGAFREALDFFQRAHTLLDKLKLPVAELMRRQIILRQQMAAAHTGFGDYPSAQDLYRSSIKLCEQLQDQSGIAVALGQLGDIALVLTDLSAAKKFYEESLALYRTLNNAEGIARTLNRLGNAAYEAGDDDGAKQLYQESLNIARQIGADWGMAGGVRQSNKEQRYTRTEEYERVKQHYEQTLQTHLKSDNKPGIAAAFFSLGNTAVERGDNKEAIHYYREAAKLLQSLNDRPGMAQVFERLGIITLQESDLEVAWGYFRQSLQSAVGSDAMMLALKTLLGVAQWFIARQEGKRAAELLAFLLHYPDTPEKIQDVAETLIFKLEDELTPSIVEDAWDVGKSADLGTLVAQLLHEVI